VNWRVRADRLRALPLPIVLAALEATPDPSDPAKWRTARGVLSVTGAKFINWNQGVGGGGAIDLVMHVQQLGFGQALQWLEDRFGAPAPAQPACLFSTTAWTLPPPAVLHWPRVERYLIEERTLPRSLLTPLVQAAILYADSRANAVFLLGDTPATAVGAELRGTTSQPWRGMAPGSRKDRGFFSVCAPSVHAIVLCESAIDALSCHVLHPTYRCVSTSGARPDPAWLGALLRLGRPIFCGFDADPTGDAMAQRMIQLHPSIRRLRPPAKDWNDALCLQHY
jgi:protein strawberry notch